MAWTRSRMRGWVVIALGLFAIPLTYVAQATHNFSDVPTSAFYHNAVEWMVNRTITSGCGVGLYCPNANVTRGQMAQFMRNLGVALTPNFVTKSLPLAAMNLDVSPEAVVCQTDSITPTFPQRARVDQFVSLVSTAGGFGYRAFVVYSTDGGANWVYDGVTNAGRTHSSAANEWAFAANTMVVDLVPGTSYKFGAQVGRIDSGSNDPTSGRCVVTVEIVNRNPGSSPLSREEPPMAELQQQLDGER